MALTKVEHKKYNRNVASNCRAVYFKTTSDFLKYTARTFEISLEGLHEKILLIAKHFGCERNNGTGLLITY